MLAASQRLPPTPHFGHAHRNAALATRLSRPGSGYVPDHPVDPDAVTLGVPSNGWLPSIETPLSAVDFGPGRRRSVRWLVLYMFNMALKLPPRKGRFPKLRSVATAISKAPSMMAPCGKANRSDADTARIQPTNATPLPVAIATDLDLAGGKIAAPVSVAPTRGHPRRRRGAGGHSFDSSHQIYLNTI